MVVIVSPTNIKTYTLGVSWTMPAEMWGVIKRHQQKSQTGWGKACEVSSLHKEPQAIAESWEQERWSSPGKNTPTALSLPNSKPWKHMLLHALLVHALTMKKQDMNLMESMGRYGEMKWKGEILKSNYNLNKTWFVSVSIQK